MQLKPIGIIHSPYKNRKECPPQGREEICWIEVFEEYKEGLKDIDGFSHLILFYWLHCSKNYSLLVKTPWDSEPHGVFATRSPNRPNALGFSVVELIERDGNKLKVKGLDALEGTPAGPARGRQRDTSAAYRRKARHRAAFDRRHAACGDQ